MSIKTAFIESIRLTPDGIKTFLETPIPTLADIALPTDEASAILAQGILAANLNTILKSYEGLTPIELVLRVGQHSNVAEALLFSALEYISESNTQQDFKILAPAASKSYTPGGLRFAAQATNGTLQAVSVAFGEETAQLAQADDIWEKSIELAEGDYVATFAAIFEGTETPQTATVSFSVAAADPEADPDDPDTPEPVAGKDKSGLLAALNTVKATVGKIYRKQGLWGSNLDALQGAFTDLCNAAVHLTADKSWLSSARSRFADLLDHLGDYGGFVLDAEATLADIECLATEVFARVE